MNRRYITIAESSLAARKIVLRIAAGTIPDVHKNLDHAFASRDKYPQPNRYHVYTVIVGKKGVISCTQEHEGATASEYAGGTLGLLMFAAICYAVILATGT